MVSSSLYHPIVVNVLNQTFIDCSNSDLSCLVLCKINLRNVCKQWTKKGTLYQPSDRLEATVPCQMALIIVDV